MCSMASPDSLSTARGVADADAGSAQGARKFDAEELGQRLLRQFESLRLLSLSLHDAQGDVLWLSEGAFGPDEHACVTDALDVFALESHRLHLERRLEDGRRAMFLAARTPHGECCGVAMVLVDARSGQHLGPELLSQRVATVLRRFSTLLAPPLAPTAPNPAVTASLRAPVAQTMETVEFQLTAEMLALPATPAPTTPASATVRPQTPPVTPASREPLRARRYARLRAGGTTRRYELIAERSDPEQDRARCLALIEHLQRRRERYEQEPSSFAVPLCADSVVRPDWLRDLAPALQRADLEPGMFGLAIPARAWTHGLKACEQFLAQCEQSGCFALLDDFSLGRSGFTLLRSPALRFLKLDAALVATVNQDKFSQATVAAIVQAARVLGLHCIAKQVDSGSRSQQWLAAAGIELTDNTGTATITLEPA